MNELLCVGRRRGHAPGASRFFQPADQSPPGPGPATGLVPAPSSPAFCPSIDPLFEASSVPSNKRKNKETEGIGLGDPRMQNSGAEAGGSLQRRRRLGSSWDPRRAVQGGCAPGRGRWDESSTQGPGQRGSHPLGYPSGAGAVDGAQLEPRQGWKDSHLARDGGGLGTKRASVGSCGARAPLGPARGGREGTRS